MRLGNTSKRRYLWLQDLVKGELPPPGTVAIENILVLGEFHQQDVSRSLQAVGWSAAKASSLPYIMPNAAVDARILPFMEGSNDGLQFVYGSSPIRGLEQILTVWPSIRQALSETETGRGAQGATLSVYYGFPPKVAEQLRRSMGREKYESFYSRVMPLLDQPGVGYKGAVGHEELARAYANSGFLLYPTQYPETGCITVQKAMASGAIPITSKYTTSVLPFLTAHWDMGPDLPLAPHMDYVDWLQSHWVPAVIKAATTDNAQLHSHRLRMKRAIREEYTWRRSAEKLLNLVNQ